MVHRPGATPKPLPFVELTAVRLAAAIREAVSDPLILERAEQLGRSIEAEDGVGKASASVLGYLT